MEILTHFIHSRYLITRNKFISSKPILSLSNTPVFNFLQAKIITVVSLISIHAKDYIVGCNSNSRSLFNQWLRC